MIEIALVGSPNSGKTALFNALTGRLARSTNYPGVTVERSYASLSIQEQTLNLIDLPGTYSLRANSLDEKITVDYIKESHAPLICVIDSTCLKRSLYLALELLAKKKQLIVALNMFDLASQRGLKLDLKKFSELLGVPVIPTIAVGNIELQSLKEAMVQIQTPKVDFSQLDSAQKIYQKIDEILNQVITTPISADQRSHQIDRWILHPWLGPIILLIILATIFQTLFTLAQPMMEFIEQAFNGLGSIIAPYLTNPVLESLVIDGILAGVGGILVFLPQIILLFIFILLLEDIGYLSRAAYLVDGLMRKVGLPGKAVVPLLSSHACAIPGIMAARTLDDHRERLATILVAPLTTCSARLPVYTLLIAAFIPNTKIFGPLTLQALTLFLLYLFGIGSAMIMALLFKKLLFDGKSTPLLMELPGYKAPNWPSFYLGLQKRAWLFIKKAGSVILFFSLIIWFLVSFPKLENASASQQINQSYAAKIGKTIEPIFRPLGFDWRITTTLIPSFAAREIMVSALSTVVAVGSDDDEQSLILKLQELFSFASIMALLVWFIYAPQCISTFAVIRKETNTWRWPLFTVGYTLALAYLMSFLAYQIFS